ncbi:MAG TPA: hypothetical protein VG734_23080 [Lacunisphaera sp.]|nr:hypothetical protein [Lacunisphaera sp.]
MAALAEVRDRNSLEVLNTVAEALGLCPVGVEPCGAKVRMADLAAIAGDHSCTPAELGGLLLAARSDGEHWLHDVLGVAAETRGTLAEVLHDATAREAIRRRMHVQLQGADDLYVARALLDYSHFQLARLSIARGDLAAYVAAAVRAGEQANATAAYLNYHVAAVRLAASSRSRPVKERTDWLIRAVLAEAFALHFLEDSFSAGHLVGHWGDDATRLGSHDHYSRTGVEVVSWRRPSDPFIAHGDAFLSDSEARAVAAAVAASLEQVLAAATRDDRAGALASDLFGALTEEQYNSCAREDVPGGLTALAGSSSVYAVLGEMPVPAARYPALTRVRAEKGLFFGASASLATAYSDSPSTDHKFSGEGRVAFRLGYGAAGIAVDPLNAQAFGEAGVLGQHVTGPVQSSNFTGFTFRLRAPGSVMLVDGLVAVALAEALKPDCIWCISWATHAAGGGFGKIWKSRPLFGEISWQFSALRDVTFNWFRGSGADGDRFEFLVPVLTCRGLFPIVGEKWSQSTDGYLDIGPSFYFGLEHDAHFGAFVQVAIASRIFP